jgi:hypothetical protein
MSERAGKIVGQIAAGSITAVMLVSIAVKVYFVDVDPALHAMFTRGGIYNIRHYLAVADVIIAVVFWLPRTMTLGLLLMVGYWGGATATVITHGDYGQLPPHLLALAALGIASYYRHPEVWTRFHGRSLR